MCGLISDLVISDLKEYDVIYCKSLIFSVPLYLANLTFLT